MAKHQQSIPVKPGERIFIKAHATLDIEGWTNSEVQIETDLNVQRIRREDEGLFLMFVDDASLKVPEQARLIVQKATGNARIRKMQGKIDISSVSGNLAVQQAKDVRIDRVSGGCLVQNIEGELEINSVGGSLKGKDCFEGVRADRISAGVELLNVQGEVDVRSMGDIRFGFLTESVEPVRLRASGSISLSLPFELNAEMKIKSNALLTELVMGDRKERINHRKHVLLVGDGRRKFDLEANGKVKIVAEKIEDTELLNLFEELETLWKALRKENETRREAREKIHDREEGEPISEGIDNGVDISLEEMGEAEKRVQDALQQVETRLQSMGFDTAKEKMDSVPVSETPDLTGERLIIMKLLGDGKISIDEADKLLEALERR